jgi:preprotein translocase subunit SecF
MIRFSRYIWLYICISSIVIVPGVYSLIRWGLKPSIDFSGGALVEFAFDKPVNQSDVQKVADATKFSIASLQLSGENTYLARTKEEELVKVPVFLKIFDQASVSGQVVRQEVVGPTIGKELLSKAILAAILAIVVILGYVAYAFKNVTFGIAAVVALIHDLLVMLGCFSLFGHFFGVEVDTLFVTAFLTTMSFSVHDTIIILDRIREYQHKGTSLPLEELTDRALTETMGRSLTNSLTIIIMLVALVLMGGPTVKWFAVGLLIGTMTGTYSSPFIAAPALLYIVKFNQMKRVHKKN